MAILTKGEIEQRMTSPIADRLVVTPLLSKKQIGDASIDVRLGNEFVWLTRAATGSHNYSVAPESTLSQTYQAIRRDFGAPLFLHPNQLVLGATMEFVGLPSNLSCYVIGRSSLGRTGLIIATATAVAPGFKGCITLEIVNVGEVPTPLYPGMRIAQLVIHDTIGRSEYDGTFQCATGPEAPLLWRDKEMKIWAPEEKNLKQVAMRARKKK
jgi:dCTP deaminase